MCQAPTGATSVSSRARGQRIALRRCEQDVLRGALWRVQCGKKPGVPYFTEEAREWKGPLGRVGGAAQSGRFRPGRFRPGSWCPLLRAFPLRGPAQVLGVSGTPRSHRCQVDRLGW